MKKALRMICPPPIMRGWREVRTLVHRLLAPLQRSNLSSCGVRTAIPGVIDRRAVNGTVAVGDDCLIEGTLVAETDESRIIIGNNVFIGGGTLLDCAVSITVENDVLISHGCTLADSNNHSLSASVRKRDLHDWKRGVHDWSTTESCPIVIRRGSWIGMKSIILKGVTVGEGAVVGAGSVVTKDVPPYTVVAGNPARTIRVIPVEER